MEQINLTPDQLQKIIEQAVSKFHKNTLTKKKYVRIREFADHFSLHKQTVHDLILKKKIKAIQMEGTTAWRIPRSEIERYEKESEKSTKKNIFERGF